MTDLDIALSEYDASIYQQREITRGGRKGQRGWYNTRSKRFMPADWSPRQPKAKEPSAPKTPSRPKQPTKPRGPNQSEPPRRPSRPAARPEPARPPQLPPPRPERVAPPAPAVPAPRPRPAAPPALAPQARAHMDRIQAAARLDLADRYHPINRMRDRLATANFGSGEVRTLRPTRDAPMTTSDHEAMDRMHSRTAAALKLLGDEQGSRAQLEAAQYHRQAAALKPRAPKPSLPPPQAPVRAPQQFQAPTAAQPAQPASADQARADAAKAPVLARFTEKIDAAGFSPQDTARRRGYIEAIVKRMPVKVVEQMQSGFDNIRFHADPEALGRKLMDYHGIQAPPGGAVGAYVADPVLNKLVLHLDGLEDSGGNVDADSDTLSSRTARGHSQVQGTYAHEMTHAIDGPDLKHSSSPEWQRAYELEIKQQRVGKYGGKTYRLSAYAAQNASEGFAEFGRLMYSTDVDHETIRKAMPRSYNYWKGQGLI